MNSHYRTSVYKLASPGSFAKFITIIVLYIIFFNFFEFCNKLSFSFLQAFIMSKVDYCNFSLLGLSAAMVDRVQHVMKAAARLFLKLLKFSHISAQMMDDLHWLPVQRRIQFKILLMTWRCISGSALTISRNFADFALHNAGTSSASMDGHKSLPA